MGLVLETWGTRGRKLLLSSAPTCHLIFGDLDLASSEGLQPAAHLAESLDLPFLWCVVLSSSLPASN